MSTPLVMVHGSFGCGADWEDVVAALGRPAHTPDLPAHGHRFAQPATSFDATVAGLVDELPAGCDLVGYSLGGRLALAAAVRAPRGTVRSLALESAHPGLDRAARDARLAADRQRAERLAQDPRAFLHEFYRADLFDTFREHPRFAAALAERIERAQRAPQALAATFEALSPGHQPELARALHASGIPTLVLVGERDEKYARVGRELADAAPASTALCTVPEAGHNVHFERPAAFVAALRSFWEGLA